MGFVFLFDLFLVGGFLFVCFGFFVGAVWVLIC